MSRLALLLLLSLLPSCVWTRSGWASRGSYRVLYESPSVQIRRGGQKIDPHTGELLIAWVGARAPEGQPSLVACELTVFVDRDGDAAPGTGEILLRRECLERAGKVLFGDVRVRETGGKLLRARMVASTGRERCVVTWRVAPD